MRVIAGQAKGRILRAPKAERTRPTSDRVKESLFAILSSKLADAVVLDLYAGSGALALEALSRGAAEAILVEQGHAASACIRHNIAITNMEHRCHLIVAPVAKALPTLAASDQQFHLVFMDPPYERVLIRPTLEMLQKYKLLYEYGMVIVEHTRKEEIPTNMENLVVCRQEHYGDTTITFLQATYEEVLVR
jgi:16S rRNA (guanine966-N2)-methyltransferase